MASRVASASFALLALAGCGRWERANTSLAETEAVRSACAAEQRAQSTTVNYPHVSRKRDGRTEIMMIPSLVASPGRDIDSCMRRQGFVRVPVD